MIKPLFFIFTLFLVSRPSFADDCSVEGLMEFSESNNRYGFNVEIESVAKAKTFNFQGYPYLSQVCVPKNVSDFVERVEQEERRPNANEKIKCQFYDQSSEILKGYAELSRHITSKKGTIRGRIFCY